MSIAPISRKAVAHTPAPVEQKPAETKAQPGAKPEQKPAPQVASLHKADTFEASAPKDKKPTAGVAKETPPKLSGEDVAKEEVKLKTVKTMREGVEKSQETLKKETQKEVDDLFAMANGKKPVPEGMEVKKVGDDRVEVRRKDDKGNPSEFTVATRGKDGELTLNAASFKDGVNARDRIELKKDGSTLVENAQWKSDKSEAGSLKSLAELKDSRDPNVSYSSELVRKEGEKLHHDTVLMKDGGVAGSSTLYEQQPDKKRKEWIDKKLHGPFDWKKEVDRTTTMSYAIPPPGKDGKQEPPTFSKVHHFSQDNVTATSYVDRVLDGHTRFAGKGAHTVADFEKVRDEYKKGGGEKWDANETSETAPPKRWTVDLQTDNNTLKNQTFVEGYPDATVSTTKTRKGNEVKETYEGKTFNPNSGDKDASKLYDVKGETTKVYDAKHGTLAKLDSKITEPDGAQVEQRLEASSKETERGLETSQKLTAKRTKDGKSESTELQEKWLTSDAGEQLLHASGKVIDDKGREAIHEIGEDGEKMRIKSPGQDARDVTDPEKLGDVEKELMATAAATNADRVASSLANGGAKSLELLKGVKEHRTGKNPKPGNGSPMPAANKLGGQGLEKLKKFGGPGLLGAGGVVGVVAGAMGLAQAVRQGNGLATGKGITDMVGGLATLGEAGAQVREALKNVNPDLKGLSVVDRVKTNLFKASGVAGIVGAGAGIAGGIIDVIEGTNSKDKWQKVKGGVAIGAAVGGLVAAAAGGPIGLAVGGLLAVGSFVVGKIMDAISDKPHKIAELTIDD
ncbi:hypothetical protein [Hyalangium rubrum]|uniref:Uncharacterized protein n=1 Tax=Hyalangium rubrum TaxID=3103134 RepID=A0ABU5GZP2_9BACT|nr:hypothetical protein [Hyalangium sp. s54d21]MDY7226673.1 hypothetical protein [Hyalangium sp. s54d21]